MPKPALGAFPFSPDFLSLPGGSGLVRSSAGVGRNAMFPIGVPFPGPPAPRRPAPGPPCPRQATSCQLRNAVSWSRNRAAAGGSPG